MFLAVPRILQYSLTITFLQTIGTCILQHNCNKGVHITKDVLSRPHPSFPLFNTALVLSDETHLYLGCVHPDAQDALAGYHSSCLLDLPYSKAGKETDCHGRKD